MKAKKKISHRKGKQEIIPPFMKKSLNKDKEKAKSLEKGRKNLTRARGEPGKERRILGGGKQVKAVPS